MAQISFNVFNCPLGLLKKDKGRLEKAIEIALEKARENQEKFK